MSFSRLGGRRGIGGDSGRSREQTCRSRIHLLRRQKCHRAWIVRRGDTRCRPALFTGTGAKLRELNNWRFHAFSL
jgi:hypothetical protein